MWSSSDLLLSKRAELIGRSGCDDQIASLCLRVASHDLSNRADGVHDRRAGGIGGERRQRLEPAVRLAGKSEHVGSLRLQTRDGCLDGLPEPLIEQSHT